MIDTLSESFSPRRKLLVFAASSDKDVPGMLQLLAPQFDGFFLTRFGKNTRAVEPGRLAAWLAEMTRVPRHTFDDAAEAWRAARAAAGAEDLVAVSGSVFLAGELRPVMMTYV
jgi:dihydrofolate synthase/folylpolyglutamate synthase